MMVREILMARPREYDEVMPEVQRLLGLGWTVRLIAQTVGISKSTVHRMRSRTGEPVVQQQQEGESVCSGL